MNVIRFVQLIATLIFVLILNISNASQFNGFVDLENVELEKTQVNGGAEFKNSKFQSLEVNGTLNFKNLTVSESVEINGTIKGKNIKCNNLIVSGSLEGHNIHVNGYTIVSGYLSVHDSFFEELKINSDKIFLNNTTTKKIVIKASKNKVKQQLILKGKTMVNGDIIFESESGEILLDKQAKITGQVIGGRIIHTKT